MIPFQSYRYIYPPRAETVVPSSVIDMYEHKYLGQPKLNGSCIVVFTNGNEVILKNRSNEDITNVKMDKKEFLKLHRGKGWMVLVGEYLNKNKKNHTNKPFNHKFVIFDIIVLNNMQLIGQTFEERVQLLDQLYGTIQCEDIYLYQINEYTYRVKSFTHDFKKLYGELIPIDMYEGFVFKKRDAKLQNGSRGSNNFQGQAKCRKPTKNYSY